MNRLGAGVLMTVVIAMSAPAVRAQRPQRPAFGRFGSSSFTPPSVTSTAQVFVYSAPLGMCGPPRALLLTGDGNFYSGRSSDYELQMEARRQALLLESSAEAEADRAYQQSQADYARLSAANAALEQGKIGVAARIFERLSRSKNPNEHTQEAAEQLKTLTAEARKQLAAVADRLAGVVRYDEQTLYGQTLYGRPFSGRPLYGQQVTLRPVAAGGGESASSPDLSDSESAAAALDPEAARNDKIQQAFADYARLVHDYGSLPGVGQEIKRQVDRQRRNPEYQSVLREPEAAALWAVGQKHEQAGQLCYAMLAYEKAAELAPALSGLAARNRLAVMRLDPQLVAAAESCRLVRQCLAAIRLADLLAAHNPERAKTMYADVVSRAPPESAVHAAAAERLARLP